MAKGLAAVLKLFLVAILAFPAHVTAATDGDNKSEARARFLAGQSHYNLNEFNEALLEFKEAYRLFPDPVFLYNLGQCERQLDHYDEAILFYRSFLRNQPKAPNRAEVQRKIEEMETALKNRPPETPVESPKPVPGDPVSPEAEPATPAPELPAPTPTPPAPTTGATAPLPVESPPESPPAVPETGKIPGEAPSPLPTAVTVEPSTPPAGALNLEQAAPPTNPAPPIYRRWWFWTATGVVVVGAATAMILSRSGGAAGPPETALGGKRLF